MASAHKCGGYILSSLFSFRTSPYFNNLTMKHLFLFAAFWFAMLTCVNAQTISINLFDDSPVPSAFAEWAGPYSALSDNGSCNTGNIALHYSNGDVLWSKVSLCGYTISFEQNDNIVSYTQFKDVEGVGVKHFYYTNQPQTEVVQLSVYY